MQLAEAYDNVLAALTGTAFKSFVRNINTNRLNGVHDDSVKIIIISAEIRDNKVNNFPNWVKFMLSFYTNCVDLCMSHETDNFLPSIKSYVLGKSNSPLLLEESKHTAQEIRLANKMDSMVRKAIMPGSVLLITELAEEDAAA